MPTRTTTSLCNRYNIRGRSVWDLQEDAVSDLQLLIRLPFFFFPFLYGLLMSILNIVTDFQRPKSRQ